MSDANGRREMKVSDPKSIGKPCPICKREITKSIQEAVLTSRKQNAIKSQQKARENGNKLGRPKIRDDAQIRKLRSEGHSIRDIAVKIGLSTAAVMRGLK